MTRTAGAIYRLCVALVVCVLLAPHAAHAAERSVVADFDGDGYHDRATLDGREPSVLRIWLSTTRTTAIVRSRSPLAGIAASDLDGDGRAELIAHAPASGLQVWTRRHTRFSRVRPRQAPPGAFERPARHNVEDDPRGLPVAVAPAPPSSAALASVPQPRAPASVAAAPFDPGHAAPPLAPARSPFAPRPPPLSR
jgi:hypothetical protein